MRPAWLLAAVAVVLSVAAFGFEHSRSTRAEHDSQASMAAELRELRSETQRMQAQLVAIEEARQEQRAAKPLAVVVPPEIMARLSAAAEQRAAVTDPEPSPARTRAEEREETLEYARYLDDQLVRVNAKDDLATKLEAEAGKYFDKGSALLELRCGKDLCRMKTRHVDGESYHTFQANAFGHQERLWSGPTTFVVLEGGDDNGGPLVAATYLGRGSALPSSEPAR
jgi:hypothetical protein